MASKKTQPRKRKSGASKAAPPPSIRHNLVKAVAGLVFLALLVVAAALVVDRYLPRPVTPPAPTAESPPRKAPAPPPEAPRKAVSRPAPAPREVPPFEIFPPKDSREPQPEPPPPLPGERLPKVAIIIDDLGYERAMAEKFLRFDGILTLAILPHSPLQKEIAQKAQQRGMEVMLHLPMEPREYPKVNPGPGALLTTMTPNELIAQLEADLDAVPFARGVNNHMGSRMTAVSTQMYQVFSILKGRGLFFIDSRTTPESLCKPSARLLRLPFAERDIFLDHVQTRSFVRKQTEQLITIAEKYGQAVGIGHPHPVTYDTLVEMLPRLKQKTRLVPASSVVRIIG